MKMTNSEYEDYKSLIRDWADTKEALQRLYDEIFHRFDDGAECLRMLDKYQSRWTMDLH